LKYLRYVEDRENANPIQATIEIIKTIHIITATAYLVKSAII